MKASITFTLAVLALGLPWAAPLKLTESERSIVQQFYDECEKMENLTKDDVNHFIARDFTGSSQALKCFAACYFEKMGQTKDNKVKWDVVNPRTKILFGENKIPILFEKCGGITGETRCDFGFKLFFCFEAFEKANA